MTGTLTPTVATFIFSAIAGILGLQIGSFINVLAYRVPEGISLVSPGSFCPTCGHEIKGSDNIPVIAWLALRGKCRNCREPISAQYPIVEALVGVLFALTAWWAVAHAVPNAHFGFDPVLYALLPFLIAGPALAVIDMRLHRLPNALTYPLYPLSVAGLIVAGFVGGTPVGEWPWMSAVLSALAWWLLYAAAFVFSPIFLGKSGMGLGDVKLAPTLGLVLGWVGWSESLTGLMAGFLIGSVVSVALISLKIVDRRGRIPFGPFMVVGAWVGLVFGGPIGVWYTSLFGLN